MSQQPIVTRIESELVIVEDLPDPFPTCEELGGTTNEDGYCTFEFGVPSPEPRAYSGNIGIEGVGAYIDGGLLPGAITAEAYVRLEYTRRIGWHDYGNGWYDDSRWRWYVRFWRPGYPYTNAFLGEVYGGAGKATIEYNTESGDVLLYRDDVLLDTISSIFDPKGMYSAFLTFTGRPHSEPPTHWVEGRNLDCHITLDDNRTFDYIWDDTIYARMQYYLWDDYASGDWINWHGGEHPSMYDGYITSRPPLIDGHWPPDESWPNSSGIILQPYGSGLCALQAVPGKPIWGFHARGFGLWEEVLL